MMPPATTKAKSGAKPAAKQDEPTGEEILAQAREEADTIRKDAEEHAKGVRESADKALADAKEQAKAVLAGAAVPDSTDTDEYRVVNCGASYQLPGVETSRRFALKGETITLAAAEAERLRDLGAIVGVDEPDPVSPGLPEGDNPVGGKALESQEAHAAKVKASQKA